MMNLILIRLLLLYLECPVKNWQLCNPGCHRCIFCYSSLFGFPIKDVFRKDVTVDAKVVIKDDSGTCIVEASDHQPRSIPNCPYKVGDTIIVTFKEGTEFIEHYKSKS